ncbi:MAG: DUF928 domain-containing protein [Cyanobacteria bacterium P01_G01_bin.38]
MPIPISSLLSLLVILPTQAPLLPSPLPPSPPLLTFTPPPPPDNLGAPGQRSDGAGSRGCGDIAQLSPTETPLTALVPLYESTQPNLVFSKTSTERPTLWVYTPYSSPHTARFALLNSADQPVYETNVELPDTPGVIRLSLPDTMPPLEPGEPYHWFFNVYCQSPPPLAFVEGWLQRDTLTAATADQLAQLSASEQVDFYTANGFWQDALTAAAISQQSNANDTHWADLLQAVGLEDLASEPIIDF